MTQAIPVELQKLRRSMVTLLATASIVVLLPLMAFGFYSVALQGGTGPLAQKAGAFLDGEGWEGYLGAVDQIAAVAVFLGAGIVVAWMFGREHADRTFSSLFALPVARGSIAGAKFVVLIGWVTVLSLLLVVSAFALGFVAGVGDLREEVLVSGLVKLFAVALSGGVLSLTMGFAASIGRGYLPAVGAIIGIVAAAQISVLFGTGGWFPYAIPGLIAVSGTQGAPVLSAIQVGLVPITAAVGVWLTVHWWQQAEVV
jgi:ABC-2 type transport system permease protein